MAGHTDPGDVNLTRRDFLCLAAAAGTSLLYRPVFGNAPAFDAHLKTDYAKVIDGIRQTLPGSMAGNRVRGVAVALIDGQQLVWAEGFGFTDIAKTKPVTAETVFSLQSISKTYTATAFMMALDKGWFKLDDPLKKHMPGFKINSRFGAGEADKITFRHLLSHWAGLPHEAPVGNNFDDRPCTFDEHINSIPDAWLRFPVGSTYCYSNLGIDLAGYAMQVRANKPFHQFMRETLLAPLGMSSSTFDHSEAVKATSFAGGDVGNKELLTLAVPMIPSGGMYSNVRDMARFVSFQLAGGRLDSRRLVSKRMLREMYTPQFPVRWQVSGYGLGIFSKRFHGGTLMWHGGGGYGYTTMQYWMPEYQLGVVVLSNDGDGSSLTDDLANKVLEQMISAKYGHLPPSVPVKLIDKPVIRSDERSLNRFAGTYKSYSGLLTLKVENGQLQMVRGGGSRPLDAHSPTEFTANTGTPNEEKLTFQLDRAGKPVFVHNIGDNGTDFFMPNDSPTDLPGPDRPEWSQYTGAYRARAYETDVNATILVKNGYLYTGRGVKLIEYKSGMFFTTDGEAVIFSDGKMLFGNRPYVKTRA